MAGRKRPEQLTPRIRWNAHAREYEKALIAFARELTKSVGYHALAAAIYQRPSLLIAERSSLLIDRAICGVSGAI